MPTLHTIHHLQAAVRNLTFRSLKTLSSSFRNLYTQASTLPRDKQLTSVWSSNVACSVPILSHNRANKQLFTGIIFKSLPYSPHHLRQELDLLEKF